MVRGVQWCCSLETRGLHTWASAAGGGTRTAAAQPATADETWGRAGRTDRTLQWQRNSSNGGRPGTEGLCFERAAGWGLAGSAGAALESR